MSSGIFLIFLTTYIKLLKLLYSEDIDVGSVPPAGG